MLNVFMGGAIIVLMQWLMVKISSKFVEVEIEFFSKKHTEIAKGIAIFIVVISHVGNFSGARYFTFLGGVGVALFLICSGFGLYKSYEKKGLNDFFRKRLSKVIIPYWCAVLIFYIIHPSEFSALRLIQNLLLIKVNCYYWFIQLIIILYIVFYLVYRFIPQNKRELCLGVLSVIFFVAVRQDLWASQAFSFVIGIFFAKYYKKNRVNRKFFSIGILNLMIGVASLLFKQTTLIRNGHQLVFSLNQVILYITLAMSIIYLSYFLRKMDVVSCFSVLGRVSYEVYLVHVLFIFIVSDKFSLESVMVYVAICSVAVSIFNGVNKRIRQYQKLISMKK